MQQRYSCSPIGNRRPQGRSSGRHAGRDDDQRSDGEPDQGLRRRQPRPAADAVHARQGRRRRQRAGASSSIDGEIVAVVNNGSNTVALYRRDGNGLRFDKLVTTTSAPVSIDFGNDHMYVAGATTVDSFVMHRQQRGMAGRHGVAGAGGGGAPPGGSTAQVGVVDERRLLVTLKTDPDPGTVDVVALRDGAVTGAAPAAVSAPAGTLTPFGFSVYPDGTAVITLAHSSQDGLFRNGAFTSVIDAGQARRLLDDAGRQVRLHREHRQQDDQPADRHREQRVRRRIRSRPRSRPAVRRRTSTPTTASWA